MTEELKSNLWLLGLSIGMVTRVREEGFPLGGKVELQTEASGLREGMVWRTVQKDGEWATNSENAHYTIIARPARMNPTEEEWRLRVAEAEAAIEEGRQRMIETGYGLDPK